MSTATAQKFYVRIARVSRSAAGTVSRQSIQHYGQTLFNYNQF